MTRKLNRTFLLALTGVFYTGICSAVCPGGVDIVRIGVDKYDGSDTNWKRSAAEVWEPLENFLNEELKQRGASVCIKLEPGEADEHLWRLTHPGTTDSPALHGAILPPFRYAIVSSILDNLDLLAKMRRPDFGQIQDAWKKGELPVDTRPRASYRSIVVMRRNAGTWPPDKGRRLRFHYRSTKSTSSFLFPMEFFRSKGWLGNNAIVATSEGGVDDTVDSAWRIIPPRPYGRRTKELFAELTSTRPGFDLLGTNDETVAKYLSDNDRLNIAEVFRSEPIPFDALVIRSGLAPFTHKKEQIAHIRSAFLATRYISPRERNAIFPWPPDLSGFKDANPHRYPDIHDWVETSSDDYDGVRKAAVLATGGTVVRLAVSGRVHSRLKLDRELYFNRVVHKLLNVDKPGDRIFLDIQYRKAGELSAMSSELRAGKVDLAELPAYQASELVGKGFPIFGSSQFLGASQDSYKFVIVTNREGASVNELDSNARFAITTKDSSSGYRWPYLYLRDELGLGTIDDENLVERGDRLGVMQALLLDPNDDGDIGADYGFMAEFEFDRETGMSGKILSDEQKQRLHKVNGASGEVPNAVLVMTPNFSPLFRTYYLEPKPKFQFSKWIESFRSGTDPLPVDRNKQAIQILQQNMFAPDFLDSIKNELVKRGKNTGFIGYKQASPKNWEDLRKKYEAFNPRHIALLVTSLLLMFLSTIGVLVFRYHQAKNQPKPTPSPPSQGLEQKPGDNPPPAPPGPGSEPDPSVAVVRDQIFFSYSHEDRKWLKRLRTMLKPAQECHGITTWDDNEIEPGQQWKDEITAAMNRASVAVLMVSPDFLASKFITGNELPDLLRAAKQEGVKILWISLRSSLYEDTEISNYQALNNPKQPLDGLPENEQDEALKKICHKIVTACTVGKK